MIELSLTKEALESGYKSMVAKMFNFYVESLISPDSDPSGGSALKKFKKGLESAQKALTNAKKAAGVD